MATKKATVWAAWVNGTSTQIKAYKKTNALARFQQLEPSLRTGDLTRSNAINSHQGVVEELYPEICK
jgi:hypothetical protein